MGNMILDVVVLLAKYHQPSWIKFFPCHLHLSWLSLERIDCIIFGDLMKCYLFFFSYCPNLCVSFLQIDYNHLVSGSVVGSFRAGSSMTPPFLHDLVKSPLECGLAWWLASNTQNTAKGMECHFYLGLYKTEGSVLLDSCSTKGEYPKFKV